MTLRAAIFPVLLFLPGGAAALSLEFPAVAIPTAERLAPKDSHFIALAPFRDGEIDGVVAEGALRQQAWKVGAGSLTTLQILEPLRGQLESAGYAILFECKTRDCGGFDFRYRLDILPEPDMHINLGDFRYFSAKKSNGAEIDHVAVLVSRSSNAGFVQVTQIGASQPVVASSTSEPPPAAATAPPPAAGSIGRQLETNGFARLGDLTFASGSSQLGTETFASLAELAEYIETRPEARITLVGHTDAVGSLEANIALSRKRARSVANRLVEAHGVPRAQVSSDGIGYLAPRSSNLTDAGRAQNRRVEVILTSTK